MKIPVAQVLCAVALGALASGAYAQPTPATPPTPESPQNTVNKRAQADADYDRARAACDEKAASEQDACFKDADAAYEKALGE